MAPLLPRPGREASVNDLMQITGTLFKATVLPVTPVAMLATLVNQVPNFYLLSTGWTLEKGLPTDRRYWLLLFLTWLPGVFLSGLVTLRQQAMMGGAVAGWAQLSRRMIGLWPRLVLTLLLGGIATLAGFALLVVPGIFLVFCFFPLQPLALSESLQPVDALVRCYRLVRPVWVKVVSSCLIALLICLVFWLLGIVLIQLVTGVVQLAAPGLVGPLGETLQVLMIAIASVYLSALAIVLYSSASSSA